MAQIVMVKLVVLIGSSLMGKKDEDTRLATSWVQLFFVAVFGFFTLIKTLNDLFSPTSIKF